MGSHKALLRTHPSQAPLTAQQGQSRGGEQGCREHRAQYAAYPPSPPTQGSTPRASNEDSFTESNVFSIKRARAECHQQSGSSFGRCSLIAVDVAGIVAEVQEPQENTSFTEKPLNRASRQCDLCSEMR